MKFNKNGFSKIDWKNIIPLRQSGSNGISFAKVVEIGNYKLMMVDYSSGFEADSWCAKGHILLVLDGEVGIKMKDGTIHLLTSEKSINLPDDINNPHFIYSEKGGKVFMIE
ncbi:MAG: hypothetical protein C4539_13690 [Ignavibacteriales bacterium]|nr:MAG: hypothetical protein C4539_13690 [Ignavibacteriales bacterium]